MGLTADLVIRGAHIYTMDPAHAQATAMAATGSRITCVGADSDVTDLIGPHTKVLELDGQCVTPGLIDSHIHLVKVGLDLDKVIPATASSTSDIVALVRQQAAHKAAGQWLWVFGEDHCWDASRLPGGLVPSADELDMATTPPGDRPLWQ